MGVVWSCEIKNINLGIVFVSCTISMVQMNLFFSVGMTCEWIGAKRLPRRIT